MNFKNKVFITDNPEVKLELPYEQTFLMYQLYNWRIREKVDPLSITGVSIDIARKAKKAKIIRKISDNDNVVGIVAPSNYKLIYDLIFIKDTYGKELTLYTWDSWIDNKPITISKEYEDNIKKLFDEYLQRGYLSLKNYDALAYYNMPRIEQFIIAIMIAELNSQKPTTTRLGLIKQSKSSDIKTQDISLIGMLRVLMHIRGSFQKAIDKLTYHARKNQITDPFMGSFKIIAEKTHIRTIYETYKDSDLYLGIDKTSAFKKNKAGITPIIESMSKIIPLVDVVKTMRYMERVEILKPNNQGFDLFIPLNKQKLIDYMPYIETKNWENLYKTKEYNFQFYFPAINETLPLFRCPSCSTNLLRENPTFFSCDNSSCQFKFDRIIKPAGISKAITKTDFLKLLTHGFTHIKNKAGGYSLYKVWSRGNLYKAIPINTKTIEQKEEENTAVLIDTKTSEQKNNKINPKKD